jgi:hypothetical protein
MGHADTSVDGSYGLRDAMRELRVRSGENTKVTRSHGGVETIIVDVSA